MFLFQTMGQGGQQVQLQGSSDMSQLQVQEIIISRKAPDQTYHKNQIWLLIKTTEQDSVYVIHFTHLNLPIELNHFLLDLVTLVITDLYLRRIRLCKPLSTNGFASHWKLPTQD